MQLNKVTNKFENITNKITIIMRNRLVLAILLIVDGISFILKPDSSITDMARSVIFCVLIATVTLLITNISTNIKDKKTIIINILIILLSIVMYFFSGIVSGYLKLILAFLIIINGIVNILNNFKLDKLSTYIINKESTIKDLMYTNKDFERGIDEQTKKVINPLINIIGKTSKKSLVFVVLNIISIILGILLLVKSDITMVIWGLIFIYTGLSDFIMVAKSMNISKKIKEKDYKAIIYDREVNK